MTRDKVMKQHSLIMQVGRIGIECCEAGLTEFGRGVLREVAGELNDLMDSINDDAFEDADGWRSGVAANLSYVRTKMRNLDAFYGLENRVKRVGR